MLPLLLTLSLAAGPATLVVWGGGKSPDDAKKALEDWKAKSSTGKWLDYLKLADGFPRVVESATVQGLNPGFHIVVLGACADAQAAATLEMLKILEPAIYSKPVTWPDAPSCPSGRTYDYGTWSWGKAAKLKTRDYELTAVTFSSGAEETAGAAVAVRYEPKGGTAAVQWFPLDDCAGGDMTTRGQGLAIDNTCITGRCTSMGHSLYRTTFSVKDGKVVMQDKELKVLDKAQCD